MLISKNYRIKSINKRVEELISLNVKFNL